MTPVLLNSTIQATALAWTKKKCSLKNGKLKVNRASVTEDSENNNNKKQLLATLKRLKRGDDNKLKRSLRLENVVSSKQLRLAVETEEERRARLENNAAPKRLRLAMEMDEVRKARLERW